jgi:prolyl oligopeptidase
VSGSDWFSIHVKDVTTGKDLPDKLEKAKFSSIEWTKDGKGFFYGCYPETLQVKSSNIDEKKHC